MKTGPVLRYYAGAVTAVKIENSLDSDKGQSGFTPLVRLPAIRMSHALDIRRHTRADFAGSLDGVLCESVPSIGG